jgi:hypothetical protein
MKQAGYISSETLSDLSDAHKIMAVSMWHKIDNWNTCAISEVRKENEAEFEKFKKCQGLRRPLTFSSIAMKRESH